ncbi:hypothetical protein EV127DRAFT_187673 [Xylaria flabelliformis]|nr:hypothetical protein EV127DRAFT_187673 [Xylaria flabelliformis]
MENINRAIVDGAHVVARVVEFQVRQAVTSSMESATPSLTGSPSMSATGSPSMMPVPSMSSAISSSTDPAASPSAGASDNPSGGGGGGGSSSSPLLFFVALGFGVVFTNLWIIVGVKYCFRYNARNRAMARLDENGEPIDLQNMPARPHRRRREKKLMTMDEVNEKFPMVKYKTWVLERKKEGLPTAGGISAPSSRPNSVRSVEGIIPEQTPDPRDSIDEPTTNTANEHNAQNQPKSPVKDEQKSNDKTLDENAKGTVDVNKDAPVTNDTPEVPAAQTETPPTKDSLHRSSEDDEDEDDDDHINSAIDPDMMGSSGDTCAICIDTLEDDDDVRGLTCGHAFHAVCLDPWLTNRRACCPLCKADYYTPKARPQPAEGETRDPNTPTTAPDPSRNNGRLNYPRAPVRSFAWSHFRDAPRQMWSSRFDDTPRDPAQMDRRYRSRQLSTQASRTNTINQVQTPQEEGEGNAITRFRNRFPPFRLNQVMRRNQQVQGAEAQASSPNTGTAPATTTPSQLEAGVRPSTTQPN